MRAKRLLDLVLVAAFVPLWLPLLALTAVLVRVNLGAPVFFRQKRPGRREQIFELVKFRTMRDDRDEQGNLRPDPERLTPFGRWLRASSLDELPEIFNVLRGEMSLVGPRPLLVHYLPRYTAEQRRRHRVPPGVTGWAQVNGRNRLTWEERFQLDVWYVDHRHAWLDLKILLLTVVRVLQRKDVTAQDHASMPEFGADEAKREK